MSRLILPRRNSSTDRITHKLIAQTAKELAGAYYEIKAGESNEFYKMWPNQRHFISRRFRTFIPTAREVLVSMLAGNYPDAMKEEIFEALQKDAALNPSRAHAEEAVRQEKAN